MFVSFLRITFTIGNFTDFKALFPAEATDFPSLVHVKI